MKKSLVVVSLALFCLSIDQSHSRVEAETIDCEFYSSWWPPATEDYLYYCIVGNEEIFNTGDHVYVGEVEGEHNSGKGFNDVQGIEIGRARNMGKFPQGLKEVFPNLIMIYITSCYLKEMTSYDLAYFPSLKYLRLEYNQLTHLSEDLFQHNNHLEHLNLAANEIVHVDTATFSSLEKLRYLDFTFNPCDFGNADTREKVEEIVMKIEAGECQSDVPIATTEVTTTTTTTTEDPRINLIHRLGAEIEALNGMVRNQETHIDTLETENYENKEQLKTCTTKDDKEQKFQDLAAEKAKLEENIKALEANKKAMAEMGEQVTAQMRKQAADFETLKAERDEIRAKLEMFEQQAKEKDQQISACQQRVEGESTKINKILQKMEQQEEAIVSKTKAGQEKIFAAVGEGCGKLSTSYDKLSERFNSFTAVLDQLLVPAKKEGE